MATATYVPAQFRLDVAGTSAAESVTVSRNAGGTLLVNAGAVPVTGGPATIANTDLIEVTGLGGADTIALDEALGALPAAELFGGTGNDSLTGGSAGDLLSGDEDDDTLFGRGGADLLLGSLGNDTLSGGDGDDQMFGGDGNDRMVWNPGDDSDLMEGGDGADIAEVNGGGGAEVFTVTANGTRVRFDRIDPAPFALDIGTTEALELDAGGGDDTVSATGNLAALIALTLDGGDGNDTILGGNGADTLLGGIGNDFVDGNQGNDIAFLGDGADIFQWDPGDGSDTVEGQTGTDTLLFNGSAANEIYALTANGARVQLTRNIGNIVMDLNGVETFTLNALGGSDAITIGDLTGTNATAVNVNLASTIGGSTGDALADTLSVDGSNAANAIAVTGAGTSFSVSGLVATVTATTSEGANDSLTVNGRDGNDTITATTLAAGIVRLVIDGGVGNDTIQGSQGADTILAGDGNDQVLGDNGNDVAFLGAGEDRFEWNPGDGNDTVEGQADLDELLFNGSNASETVTFAANGGRALLFRDVAAVTMDLDDVEKITFHALGGSDTLTVGDLSGTDVTTVELHLEASGGGGDGAVDTVTVNATNGSDALAISSAGGIVSTSGLPWTVSIDGAESINDRLTFNAAGGDDTINAGALATGLLALFVNGGLGNDTFIGSAGTDVFNGGDGNDTALLGGGDDIAVWNPGDDSDVVEGQAGIDTLRFNGANIAEIITLSPNGGRALFFRDIANVTMDLNDTEVIEFNALGGADTITVGDLSRTDVTTLAIDLASTVGGAAGDAQVDTLTLSGSGGSNTIDLSGTSGALLSVTGLPANVTISQFETSGIVDRLTILGLGGHDVISATGLVPKITTLTIDGGAGNDTIRSNGDGTYLAGDGNDTVFAGLTSSAETIDGGAGIDTLDTTSWGGPYVINLATGATNYSGELFTNFENLVLGAGNDTVTGTAGNNTLNGGGGADQMAGGLGNDTYIVDDAGDAVSELNGEGTDLVRSSVTFSLIGLEVERLSLTGSGNIDGTGNGLANVLTGNSRNNRLDGGANADRMDGGLGNDTYIVDNAGDTVTELNGEGTDQVRSFVSFSLGGRYIENLSLTGSGNINGTGNSQANVLTGNSRDNTLNGGGGADQMTGGLGNDTFAFSTALGGSNVDTITDFDVLNDRVRLEDGIFSAIVGTGTLTATQFVANASGTAADASDRIVYETDTGNLFYDSNGSAAGGRILFAELDAGLALTNQDFFVV